MLDCRLTRLYDLINAGELEVYMDGGSRKITVRSIHARVQRLLEKSVGIKKACWVAAGAKPPPRYWRTYGAGSAAWTSCPRNRETLPLAAAGLFMSSQLKQQAQF